MMSLQILMRFLPLIFLLRSASGDTTATVATFADVNTECKSCPHSLCPNILAYEQGENANVTCWTRGTRIVDTTLWLRSTSSCYVTEYDLHDNVTDYTSALPYCGSGSGDENLTLEDATLRYKTECRICPTINCDTVAYLKEETEIELTCWTPYGQVIIDDSYWMKTTNNCYVAQKNLYSKPDMTYLDFCGPIPFLETGERFSDDGPSDVDKRDAGPVPGPFLPNYLINVTVGEDFALCRSCAQETCGVEKRYVFDQEVWLQCLVDMNGTWWSETTDFCYVKNSDFWQSPEGDCKSVFPLLRVAKVSSARL